MTRENNTGYVEFPSGKVIAYIKEGDNKIRVLQKHIAKLKKNELPDTLKDVTIMKSLKKDVDYLKAKEENPPIGWGLKQYRRLKAIAMIVILSALPTSYLTDSKNIWLIPILAGMAIAVYADCKFEKNKKR